VRPTAQGILRVKPGQKFTSGTAGGNFLQAGQINLPGIEHFCTLILLRNDLPEVY
jgi:hypothetical protein